MSDARQARRTFTLVELLIVITILVILAMLLLPVLSNAKRQARRVVCMSNLHQYAPAFAMYAADYNRQLPLMVRDYWGSKVNPLPAAIWLGPSHRGTITPPSAVSGMLDVTAYLNFESLGRYSSVPDFASYQPKKQWYPGGIWHCPEISRRMSAADVADQDREWGWGRLWGYSYFGRADEIRTYEGVGLSNWANFYGDLLQRDLAADRLLVADLVFRWWVTKSWYFSHGPDGLVPVRDMVMTPETLRGMHQAYGDGRVVWAKPTYAELGEFMSLAPTGGRVGGGPTADNTFYLRGR